MGGRGNGAARNTGSAGSAVANKNVAGTASVSEKVTEKTTSKLAEVPKSITSKNVTPEIMKSIIDNPAGVPVGTTIKYYVGGAGSGNQILRHEGNGVWSAKDMQDGGRFTIGPNPYRQGYKKTDTPQSEAKKALRNAWSFLKKQK